MNKWDRSKIKIYNYTSGNTVPLKWGEIYGYAKEQLMLNPLDEQGGKERPSTESLKAEFLWN